MSSASTNRSFSLPSKLNEELDEYIIKYNKEHIAPFNLSAHITLYLKNLIKGE